MEAWVVQNSPWLALGIIAAAFALRLAYANFCFLNTDEALHFATARQSSWLEAYEASFRISHPPLFILVLHGVLFLGRTETDSQVAEPRRWDGGALAHIRMAATHLGGDPRTCRTW